MASKTVIETFAESNMSTTILPAADATYDLGSSSLRWKDVHASGTVSSTSLSATHLTPNTSVSQDVNIDISGTGSTNVTMADLGAVFAVKIDSVSALETYRDHTVVNQELNVPLITPFTIASPDITIDLEARDRKSVV